MNKALNTRAVLFNRAAPGANTNILTTGITVTEGCALRVTVALTTSSVFNATCSDGTVTFTWGLNSSTALNAGDLYAFVFGAAPRETNSGSNNTLTYNFRVETNSIIECLIVEEGQLGTT
jgi:peroxiredoxin family protein